MVDQEEIIDQNGFPASSEQRTRQAPARSRSRSSPRRSKSAADADDWTKFPTIAALTDGQAMQSRLPKVPASGAILEKDSSDFNGGAASTSPKRRSPRRCKSSDSHDLELIDLAKAQMAMRAALNSAPSLGEKVKMKVIVRKKKGSKDPNRTPSPVVKNRRAIKVPAGALDFAAVDTTKDDNTELSSGQEIRRGLIAKTIEKKISSSRGREVLHREGRARSLSRRSTRSRSRGGRKQSAKINLDEDDSDTEVVEDEPDEAHGVAVNSDVEDILQNRREQGAAVLEKHNSPKAVPNYLGGKKDFGATPLLNSLENDRTDTVVSPKGGRDRFTSASEWSNVVDDLIQKRSDEKESDKDANKSKTKGLGRLFTPNRK